jgi:hypothetical protein
MKRVSVAFVLSILAVQILTGYMDNNAYGHGLGKETVGPKNVGDRLISLSLKLEPELRKAGELTDVVLTLQAIDEESKEVIPGTIVYDIKIQKYGKEEVLLKDRFHIMPDQDTLKIIFKPADSGLKIEGETMPNMGYMRTDVSDITVTGPIFLDAGLYVFIIDLVGIGDSFLDKPVRYVSYLTISELDVRRVMHHGDERLIGYISYYDTIKELNYTVDADGNIIVDAISDFNWDKEFVKDIPLLHFEYYIPKEFRELANREMKGYVNGVDANIFVDRAAEKCEGFEGLLPDGGCVIVHYMIVKSRLVRMADEITDKDRVVFRLVAGKMIDEDRREPIGIWSDAMVLKSDKGRYTIEVRYSPKEPNIDEPTKLSIKFYDAESNEEIKDIRYKLTIYNSNKIVVDDIVEVNDILTYEIKEAGAYAVTLSEINGDDRVTFGITVVPEFPIYIALLLLMGMSIPVILYRWRSSLLLLGY